MQRLDELINSANVNDCINKSSSKCRILHLIDTSFRESIFWRQLLKLIMPFYHALICKEHTLLRISVMPGKFIVSISMQATNAKNR